VIPNHLSIHRYHSSAKFANATQKKFTPVCANRSQEPFKIILERRMRMRLLHSRRDVGLPALIMSLLLLVLGPSTVLSFTVVPCQKYPMTNLISKNTGPKTNNNNNLSVRRSLVVQALASKSQQNNNAANSNGARPKNRRFSQQAHIETLRNGKNKKSRGNVGGGKPPKASHEEADSPRRQQRQQRSPQGQQEMGGDANDKNKDYMWRSGKSIDELESTMMKRWGDEISQWTADPDEVEESDDNNRGKKQNKKPSPKFRAKPVMDPWDKSPKKTVREDSDDLDDSDESTGRGRRNGGSFGGARSIDFDDGDGDDPMLSRVRRNQERLQKKRGGKSNDENVSQRKSKKNDFDPVAGVSQDFFDIEDDDEEDGAGQSFVSEKEYYDEDDEGYEPTSSRYNNNDDDDELFDVVDKLIGPRPGAADASSGKKKGRKSKSDNSATSPGFFFREEAANEYDASQEEMKEEEEKKAKKVASKRKKKSRSRAVIDENGNPTYLTVQQAERNFEASLVAAHQAAVGDNGGVVAEYTPPSTRSWEELGITSDELLDNLEKIGCEAPLSVQDKACPPVLSGNDALIGTYTGSGKTLAFLAPLAQRLLFMNDNDSNNNGGGGGDVQILIVAPGRELASQIVSVARTLLEGTGLTCMLAIGGTTFSRNLEQIRKKKPTILVGTPGRIAELVVGRPGEKSGRLKIGNIQSLVMDEFDALLEYKPHRDPTKAILQTLKRRHGDALQSVLCSATASDMIKSPKLLSFLRQGFAQVNADEDDQLVTSVAGEDDADESASKPQLMTRVSRTVIHGSIHLRHSRLALDTLRRILHTDPLPQQALIFCDSSRRVEIIVDKLSEMGIVAAPLHGGRGSEKMDRSEVSKALREGYVGLVVATEMAARGLDAPLLTHVINLDLPTDASHYAHRAGRCGRGGRPGVVINFTTDSKERNVPKRFASELGITMHNVEAQGGKLCIVEEEQQQQENANK